MKFLILLLLPVHFRIWELKILKYWILDWIWSLDLGVKIIFATAGSFAIFLFAHFNNSSISCGLKVLHMADCLKSYAHGRFFPVQKNTQIAVGLKRWIHIYGSGLFWSWFWMIVIVDTLGMLIPLMSGLSFSFSLFAWKIIIC